MRKSIYDAVIIGVGHNGLVAANYLARANKKIFILEQRHLVGDVALTNNSSMALSSSDVPTSFEFPYKKSARMALSYSDIPTSFEFPY